MTNAAAYNTGAVPEWDVTDRLRKSLRVAGMNGSQMAEYLGVTQESVSGWLNAKHAPSQSNIKLWALRTGSRHRPQAAAPGHHEGSQEQRRAAAGGAAVRRARELVDDRHLHRGRREHHSGSGIGCLITSDFSVNKSLTAKRRGDLPVAHTPKRRAKRRERSTLEFLTMVGRMVRAAGRRVGMEDEYELEALLALRDDLDEAIADAVAGQREYGNKSWTAIATATGTTRQGAQQRWGKRQAS